MRGGIEVWDYSQNTAQSVEVSLKRLDMRSRTRNGGVEDVLSGISRKRELGGSKENLKNSQMNNQSTAKLVWELLKDPNRRN